MLRTIAMIARAALLAFGFVLTAEAGQPVYKSVDEAGNVTYSAEPPSDADKVKQMELDPGPSEAQQVEAEDRARRQAAAAESGAASRVQDQSVPADAQPVQETAPAEPEPQLIAEPRRRRAVRREAEILTPEAGTLPEGATLIPMPAQ